MRRIRRTLREARGLDPSEHTEAVRFMCAVRAHEHRYPALRWLHHIPNGGWRKASVAAKLKGEGVRAGVADYFLPLPAAGHHGLYIELKTQSAGTASREQKNFAEFVTEQGYAHAFARGWEEAWRVVCDYVGIPYRVT